MRLTLLPGFPLEETNCFADMHPINIKVSGVDLLFIFFGFSSRDVFKMGELGLNHDGTEPLPL